MNTYTKTKLNQMFGKELKALESLALVDLTCTSFKLIAEGSYGVYTEMLAERYESIFEGLKGCSVSNKDEQLIKALMYSSKYDNLFRTYISYKESVKA